MRAYFAVAFTGVRAVLLYPLRSAVTVACLLAALVPYLVGIGISQAVQRDAQRALDLGADLYVSGVEFGRHANLPGELGDELRTWEGVQSVTARIVGAIQLGSEQLPGVVVGMPLASLPREVTCVEGRLFRTGPVPEIVIGSELARRLRLRVGDFIPPFYRSSQGDRVARVVGIFRSDLALWQARLIFTSLETAQRIFDQPGRVTGFLVNCRPGYPSLIAERITQWSQGARSDIAAFEPEVRLRVVERDELRALLPRGLLHREGIFNLHFVLLFVVSTLVILVTSGLGLDDRRREVGILKSVGWQTEEVLLRSFVESTLLALLGATVALLLAYGWLRWLNGFWIAGLFLAGVGIRAGFVVPFQLTTLPVMLALILALTMVLVGTLYAAWRAASAMPREALR